ncbi:uncharacterized protein [Halyomorpha halys]|nr:uncharacterized protein LOC106688982 isoform X2 [Halyomorpha halys]XP_014289193.1 uncharacterized protein LOC106688982 isoform X2 [Halyomorpha halys]
MDPLEVFPPEICLRIFKLLGPKDLCSCLAVNHQWRNLANTEKYWQLFCDKRVMIQLNEIEEAGEMPLCHHAAAYINYMNRLVRNWKECRFKSSQLPKHDWYCCIAGYKRNIAIYYPRTANVHIFHISKNVDIICDIHVGLPYGISIPDVFINEYFLVVSKGNVVLVYNNDIGYSLYKVIVGNEFGLTISSHIIPFVETDKRLYVKVINENTLWVESNIVYVVDIISDTYRALNDTFRCLRVDGKYIYAANDVVTCYNLQGDKKFSLSIRCVEDMWVKDELVVVLMGGNSQQLQLWNLKTKSMLSIIQVEKDPCVSISPELDNIYVLEIVDNLYAITCYSTRTSSLIWQYKRQYEREISIHPEIRIICDRFIFARPSHTCDKNFILLDSKSGKVLYDNMMPPCLSPPCYIYHMSDEFLITAESDTVHIRRYV